MKRESRGPNLSQRQKGDRIAKSGTLSKAKDKFVPQGQRTPRGKKYSPFLIALRRNRGQIFNLWNDGILV